MLAMRLRYRVLGGHVHCRLFVGHEGAGAKAGDLIFRVEEWTDVQVSFECGGIDVLPEDDG